MSEKIDVSGDKRTDWDKEIERGHLLRQDPSRSNRAIQGEHVQGAPITDANRTDRILSADKAKRMLEQAQSSSSGAYRPPDPAPAKIMLVGGWPTFDKDGNIVHPRPPSF